MAHAGDLSCLTVMMESQANVFFFSFCELAMLHGLRNGEGRVVHVCAHKQRGSRCHMFRVPECSLEIVGTDLLLNVVTLCPINSGKFGR